MNRRRFLREGLAGGAIAVGAASFLFMRRSQVRAEMTSRMLDDALPPLSATSMRQLNTLPARAREEIRRYFHGKCLNTEAFVSHICSSQFAERLSRCRTQDEREACFLQSFCGRVATDAEILFQVETIATETGSELDSGWDAYCTQLRGRWNARIHGYGSSLTMDELSNRLGVIIRTELAEAARQIISTYHRPAGSETIGKIGALALLLLPLAEVRVAVGPSAVEGRVNPLVLPTFFILAARSVWEYITGRLDDLEGEYRAVISSRLALLGNRVGAEFEREVRQRLTDLHTWQERSIRDTATRLAEERVGLV